jgi:uncharacterized protein YfaP (DUF2135 family)
MLNSSEVEGNSNLFNGSLITTDKALSKVYLINGVALVLGVNSAGTILSRPFYVEPGCNESR